jgi:hypothetical protein
LYFYSIGLTPKTEIFYDTLRQVYDFFKISAKQFPAIKGNLPSARRCPVFWRPSLAHLERERIPGEQPGLTLPTQKK